MTAPSLPVPAKQQAAVGAYFWLVGVAVGVWVARIPEIQAKLGIGDAQLGIVLLMSAVGALVAMPLTGRLAPRVGSRRLAWGSAALTCGLLPMIAWAPTPGALMAVFAGYGAATGMHGVVVNALAVHVEKTRSRPILSTYHGLFSLGGLAGASIAAGCLHWSIAPVPSLLGAAGAIALAYLGAARWLPEAIIDRDAARSPAAHIDRDAARSPAAHKSTRRWSPSFRHLIVLGGLAFLGLMGEGSMGDWSAVYLRRSLGASPALAGLGYAAFSLGMTVGRFSGDHLSRRMGDVALIRRGSCLAALGLGGAVLVGHPVAAIVGFNLVGAGLANAVPVLYRAASRTPGIEPVTGIATTSTVGYLGFLAGPPLIGLVASSTTLGTALLVVGAAMSLVALGGKVVGFTPGSAKSRRESFFTRRRPVEV